MASRNCQASTIIKYGGLIINSEEKEIKILPNVEKLVKMKEFSTPSNKTQVQEFLGLIRVLTIWTNKIVLSTTELGKLTCNHTTIIWTNAIHNLNKLKKKYQILML